MASVCEIVNQATNQCDLWRETMTLSDFAITGYQASQICVAVASYFVVCWVLKKARLIVK